jgi:hypothetical protein
VCSLVDILIFLKHGWNLPVRYVGRGVPSKRRMAWGQQHTMHGS